MSGATPGRRAVAWALRLAVAALGFVLAVRAALPAGDADGPGLGELLSETWRADPGRALGAFAGSFAVLGTGLALSALRFRCLLRGAGHAAAFPRIYRAYLVASFFNLILPGAILGDVYRVLDARGAAGGGSEALGLVVLERLLGLSALGLLAIAAAPWVPLAAEDAWVVGILVPLGALLVLTTLVVLHPRSNGLARRVLGGVRAVPALVGRLERMLGAVATLGERPAVVARAFLYSVATQLGLVASVFVLSLALESEVAWTWFLVVVPFVTLVSMVPISIGGAGVREYLYVTVFGAVGMASATALALSLGALGVALAWGLVGLLVFLAGRRRDAGSATA
jgi:uncharacterized protein (TIRG00374 family)